MLPYSNEALQLKLGLEAGVVEKPEIIAWADHILVNYEYNDNIANLALATKATGVELLGLLGKLIDQHPQWDAVRWVMGRMYKILRDSPEWGHDFARFLERFWVQQEYDVPEDMKFIAGIEEEFSSAKEGTYGTLEERYPVLT